MMKFGKQWTYGCIRVDGNGTKQFGTALWGNSRRLGWQINFWRWEIQIMRDFK